MTTTPRLELDPETSALVLIDLQKGILGFGRAPHDGDTVLRHANALMTRFRASGSPVVRVRVGWSPGYPDLLTQPTDAPAPVPPQGLPADWFDLPDGLEADERDLLITKRHWNAFHGTELDLQLRRRGVRTVVLGGIATPFGVESTARMAWELGYHLVLAEDACSAPAEELHHHSVERVMPRLGRVRRTAEILQAWSATA